MQLEWPREVQRRADGAGVVYELPVRPLGALRWVGIFLCGFGLLFASGPFLSVLGHIVGRPNGGSTSATVDWVELVFVIPFILAGLVPLAIGCLIVFGRCRIECRNRRLQVTESAGPFGWTRRLPDAPVRRLLVAFGGNDPRAASAADRLPAGLSALVAYIDRPRPRLLAIGYPRPWLVAIARELSTLLNPLPGTAHAPAVDVQETTISQLANAPDAEVEVESPPPGTRVRMESTGGGLTIVVPPAGLGKGSYGLFPVAVVWCSILGVISAVLLVRSGGLPGGLILVPFWLVGLGLMTLSAHLGRRRALLVAERGVLRIAQASPFKQRQWTLHAAELRDIGVGPSGMEVNDRPVLELQFHPQVGKKLGLLAGRDVQELRWIATHLRRTLGVAQPPPMRSQPAAADAPPSHSTST